MSLGLRKAIQDELGQYLLEHGFTYDESVSRPSGPMFIYSRGVPEPESEFDMNGSPIFTELINRQEIIISKSRWSQEITVSLRDLSKESGNCCIDLGDFLDDNLQKWWSIATQNDMQHSLREIRECLNLYAWKWLDS